MKEVVRNAGGPESVPEELKPGMEEAWEKFCEACGKASLPTPEAVDVVRSLKLSFLFSDFVSRRALKDPAVVGELADSGDLTREYNEDDMSARIREACCSAEDEAGLESMLRRARNREMLRIAVRNLSGLSGLFETMRDLTVFAENSIHFSLCRLYRWMCRVHGEPEGRSGSRQEPVVIGVGKLGGAELNFSSDVDLLFAFPEPGRTAGEGSSISNEEFFSKLFRKLIHLLSKNTAEGFVFRTDTRLRPYGDSGPIAMSFDSLEAYYQDQGREWERYALIKSRPVAGDMEAGQYLTGRLHPFIYRRYLDYGTFEALREMKKRIVAEVKRKGLAGNIKTGAGGIREIEFFAQVFQLIRGGVNPRYQCRQLLSALDVLFEEECISGSVYNQLRQAYIFLRDTEHRLQAHNDRQTHTLPADEKQQLALALSMGFSSWDEFSVSIAGHMERVRFHFSELLADPSEGRNSVQDVPDIAEELKQAAADRKRARQILLDLGFRQPDLILPILDQFLEMQEGSDVSGRGRERMSRLVPQILQKAAGSDSPADVLKRVLELVRSIRRRSCYMALLLENPEALTHLVHLAAASPWIVSFLSRHPLLLDELLDARSLFAPPGKDELEKELSQRMARIDSSDLESQMNELRIFKLSHTLRIAAADVADLVPLMKVSDRLTYLAETVLDKVLDLAWAHLVEKYGEPKCVSERPGRGFVIVAYGKLGGYELGYGSDLDLVFLHDADRGYTGGGRLSAIDNHQFYVRLGQRIIHFLSTMTNTGKLYDADVRLRPSGEAGVLVSHIDAFAGYQEKEAWTWEHQALIKSRPVSGDAGVGERFLEIRRQVLTRSRRQEDLCREVAGMRRRMFAAHRKDSGESEFDVKNDAGGIIDIEFLVQYLILLHAGRHPELTRWTDVVRQLNSLAIAGVVDEHSAHMLKQAYLVFRYVVHRLSLEEKPARIESGRLTEHRRRVVRIWKRYMAPAEPI